MANEMPSAPIRTILLVDDHEMVLRALHNYLEKRGYNLVEARDGDEALLGEFPATMLGWQLVWLVRSLRGQGGPVSDGGSGSNDSGRYAGTASAFRRMASDASPTITAA